MTAPHSTGRGGFEIRGGGYHEIAAAGAGLRLLDHEGPNGQRALTETWALGSKPPLSAGLVPRAVAQPNSRRHFMFDGIEHQLEITEPVLGNASHGFVRRRNWSPRGPHVSASNCRSTWDFTRVGPIRCS